MRDGNSPIANLFFTVSFLLFLLHLVRKLASFNEKAVVIIYKQPITLLKNTCHHRIRHQYAKSSSLNRDSRARFQTAAIVIL